MCIRAAIFDLDGTLADNATTWRQAEEALFAACGLPWDADLVRPCRGMNARDLAAHLHGILRPAMSVEAFQHSMQQALDEAYLDPPSIPIPGARELVRRLAPHWPLAVASGSPAAGIRATLEKLGIADAFSHLVSSEEVPRGKPAPDVFLLAAERLGVEPSACLVIEDSPAGAQGARAASMPCLLRPAKPDPHLPDLATWVVADWDVVTGPAWFCDRA